MPAYMNWRVEFASRAHAEKAMREAIAAGLPGDLFTIHDTPPVILAGLVKGGEYVSAEDWCNDIASLEVLATAADGRPVFDYDDAHAAEARGALPITWYRYPEAP